MSQPQRLPLHQAPQVRALALGRGSPIRLCGLGGIPTGRGAEAVGHPHNPPEVSAHRPCHLRALTLCSGRATAAREALETRRVGQTEVCGRGVNEGCKETSHFS